MTPNLNLTRKFPTDRFEEVDIDKSGGGGGGGGYIPRGAVRRFVPASDAVPSEFSADSEAADDEEGYSFVYLRTTSPQAEGESFLRCRAAADDADGFQELQREKSWFEMPADVTTSLHIRLICDGLTNTHTHARARALIDWHSFAS